MDRIEDVLTEANEQVNIYDGARSHILQHGLSIQLETAADWLSWMRYDALLHEQMATDENNPLFDQSSFWQTAALLRKFALQLMDLGVRPSQIAWKG